MSYPRQRSRRGREGAGGSRLSQPGQTRDPREPPRQPAILGSPGTPRDLGSPCGAPRLDWRGARVSAAAGVGARLWLPGAVGRWGFPSLLLACLLALTPSRPGDLPKADRAGTIELGAAALRCLSFLVRSCKAAEML